VSAFIGGEYERERKEEREREREESESVMNCVAYTL
jgi:hypothetical protein